jgi:hypothetical protein
VIHLSRSEAFGVMATLDEIVTLALAMSLLVLVLHAEDGIAVLLERLLP